jgi:maltose alpha-D-glucosyltransferase / alpha-amylase
MTDPLWFKDAIFYELHVKTFRDGNDDGIGDFRGLIEKLDYLEWLGVDCLWLLPFFPSPLRDDGYDVANFFAISTDYGSMADLREFLEQAHKRHIRVIVDLVLNHTSDQHPWFQEARHSPQSAKRNYYVWSETDKRYGKARVIFIDTEKSNWSWDPVANAYYWHRFFSHQPDLNYDNPEVRKAMLDVMAFWMDQGLDGFRCDAVPYLFEREDTICENLPETHAYLKEIRERVEQAYPGRILLAEANQWPADVRHYFGNGDEFHMAFHFPLMPRLFMGLRSEDWHPIVDMFTHTPPIPDNCQWCLFLRNHDELTLEMCAGEERDYMYYAYARDPQMRRNVGIARRLAPLLDNDRRKIELLNSLVFTLPGSPIIYYGDEIGMGDNVHLGDRNGVRTPMQWTADRNGGFSKVDPAKLYLPPIADSVYGFHVTNVESQRLSPHSLLHWMKQMIARRKQQPAFGRGSLSFLRPQNEKVLAYVREYQGNQLLLVHNLAGSAQAVELDLAAFEGKVPLELLGGSRFPIIGRRPYVLSLAPYGYYWFNLEQTLSDDPSFGITGSVV